jgi:dTDP-glucose pyrophosphorylase
MKGIILAAGKGTRLKPLTDPLGKEMLPVYNKPMVAHVIDTLISGGVDDIFLITNVSMVDTYNSILENYNYNGLITYGVDSRRGGPGRSLLLAKDWVKGDDFALILGDSIFFSPLPDMREKTAPHIFAMYMNDDEDDLGKYGQVILSNGKVTQMLHRPQNKISNIIQTAIWLFPADVFFKIPLLEDLYLFDIEMRLKISF